MSRNDARKFLAQGTASALTLALGLTFAAQPAFAETAKAADPAPSASAAPSAPAAETNPGLSVDPTPAAPVVAPAPSDVSGGSRTCTERKASGGGLQGCSPDPYVLSGDHVAGTDRYFDGLARWHLPPVPEY
mgnify:CR=1 FL=1